MKTYHKDLHVQTVFLMMNTCVRNM